MKFFYTIFLILMLTVFSVYADSYQFISPMPGSDNNSRETTIIIREGHLISAGKLNADLIRVSGSKSGSVPGKIVLSSDQKTVIFKPYQRFQPGETITVTLAEGLRTMDNRISEPIEFTFGVTPFEEQPNPYLYIEELREMYIHEKNSLNKTAVDSLPSNFPPINVEIHDSTAIGEGYIFLAVASEVDSVGYYLMMLNNDGTPFFSKELKHDYAYDFKMQPNGQLTYAQFLEHHSYTGGGNVIHKVMDHSFTVVDSFQMGNGYIAEAHDFQILPNGHVLLFGYYLTETDLSGIVDGGYPNALVSGGVVQELDEDKNVVFQWRTWDHYDFEDYPYNTRRSARPIVSAFHLNTINLDFDGHIFIATPQWVKKLNRQTGEIIWHLGGDENQFSFINVDSAEAVDHFGGHAFYRLPNGNVLVYDNGNRQGTRSSKIHEYRLDEENLTAEWIWSYIPDPEIYAWHRGNAQRLPNGNTVIGWGGSSGKPQPTFSEVNASGEKVMEVFFDPPDIESYRAFRFPFDEGKPSAEVIEIEVAPGSTYDFQAGDTVDTGISITINAMEGDGYNELIVRKYEYAPLKPDFIGKAPRVKPARIVVDKYAITSIEADIEFDVELWGIDNPDEYIVYHREFEDQGLFLPLSTTYNQAKKKLIANTNKIGEFILTTPDLESIIYTPLLVDPVDSSSVINQTLPVQLEWNPIGYVNEYSLQVATDDNFSNLVVDEEYMTDAIYTIESVEDNTQYFWRVKAHNDAGDSDWSEPFNFTTTAPFLEVKYPNNGETFQRGLDYFLKWEDNIDEDVVLQVMKEGQETWIVIDTTESRTAYKWSIDPEMELGSYYLRINSVTDNGISDISNMSFSVFDTTTSIDNGTEPVARTHQLDQNYPNPFNPETTIRYTVGKGYPGSVETHYDASQPDVSLTVYNPLGQKVATLVSGKQSIGQYEVKWNAGGLPSGVYFYKLRIGQFQQIRKMLLLQ